MRKAGENVISYLLKNCICDSVRVRLINKILNGEGVKKSLEFLHDSLEKLSNGEYPMDELIVTKTLRGMYKNPQQIAHKVLADRMGLRDPGNKPQSNDRIAYAYIDLNVGRNASVLQGDKIENPIEENNWDVETYRNNFKNRLIVQK